MNFEDLDPVHDHETFLIAYAYLLGAYGNDHPKTIGFVKTYGNTPEAFAMITKVAMVIRILRQS